MGDHIQTRSILKHWCDNVPRIYIYSLKPRLYLPCCFLYISSWVFHIYIYFKPYILRKKKKTISTPHQTIPSPSFPSFVSKTIFYSVAQARKLDSPWIPGFFSELICCNPAANMVSSTFKIQLKSHHYFSSPQPPHPTSLLLSLHWPSA